MWITGFTQKIECWASSSKVVYRLASKYYHDVVQNEVGFANITHNDHILCIGGGICPFSGILLHQITGAKVMVIDNNKKCVTKARQIIQRMGLNEHIQIFCQDGGNLSFPISKYTVIHFALQVCPMDYVFSQVESKVAPGTKLLVRLPKKCFNNMYSCLSKPLLRNCPCIAHKKARNIGRTMLYIKQEAPVA